MKSIVLILPYFGKWPIWFEAHLLSISKNESVNWLIFTDCEIPDEYPSNIKFIYTTLEKLNDKINEVVGFSVPLSSRKICDIRPAFGVVFEDYIKNYDFWGFCDLDIIWGNIRNFISDDILDNFDIISSRRNATSGHFTLFRNTIEINNLYKKIPNYQHLYQLEKGVFFDEYFLTDFIKNNQNNHMIFPHKVYWSTILLNQEKGRDSHQEYHLDKWQWQNGKMIDLGPENNTNEVMYLHFINWKKTFKKCEVKYTSRIEEFYISFTGIHISKHTSFEIFYNDFTNVFNGYYKKEWRRVFKKKIKSVHKRIKRKIFNR